MELDLTNPTIGVAYMVASDNEHDWNKRCDEIKVANNGYPEWWFPLILLGGVIGETKAKWSKNE